MYYKPKKRWIYRTHAVPAYYVGGFSAQTEMALSEIELAKAMLDQARAERQPPALASLIEEMAAAGMMPTAIGRKLGLTPYFVRLLPRGLNRYGDFSDGWG